MVAARNEAKKYIKLNCRSLANTYLLKYKQAKQGLDRCSRQIQLYDRILNTQKFVEDVKTDTQALKDNQVDTDQLDEIHENMMEQQQQFAETNAKITQAEQMQAQILDDMALGDQEGMDDIEQEILNEDLQFGDGQFEDINIDAEQQAVEQPKQNYQDVNDLI